MVERLHLPRRRWREPTMMRSNSAIPKTHLPRAVPKKHSTSRATSVPGTTFGAGPILPRAVQTFNIRHQHLRFAEPKSSKSCPKKHSSNTSVWASKNTHLSRAVPKKHSTPNVSLWVSKNIRLPRAVPKKHSTSNISLWVSKGPTLPRAAHNNYSSSNISLRASKITPLARASRVIIQHQPWGFNKHTSSKGCPKKAFNIQHRPFGYQELSPKKLVLSRRRKFFWSVCSRSCQVLGSRWK